MKVKYLIELLENQNQEAQVVINSDIFFYSIRTINKLLLAKTSVWENTTHQSVIAYSNSPGDIGRDICLAIAIDKENILDNISIQIKELIKILKEHEENREVVVLNEHLYYPVASIRNILLEKTDIRDPLTNKLVPGYKQPTNSLKTVACVELRT